MGMGRTSAVGLVGFAGAVVGVEAHSSDGTPAIGIIGLPDAALSQAKERVRSAAINSGSVISEYKITVNLSPAAMPKHGSAFDLAIGLAALAALGEVNGESVASVVHVGELGLDGRLRSVPGVLPAVLAAARAGRRRVMVPLEDRAEAELVDGVEIIAVSSLAAAAVWHGAEWEVPVLPEPAAQGQVPVEPVSRLDFADVIGNEEAAEAMIAAAAGGHHVFLLGPPGAGKTMLATRLPGILPDLDDDAALEATCMRSLVGTPTGGSLVRRPPFESPHHSASAAAIVGGGSGRIRPGAVARATRGVLFLDEAPEFSAVALDALRQPLESGVIRIHRANAVAEFPARVQLVLAANPCPCGRHGIPGETCTCAPALRRRYLARLSGPLLDRVDIRLTVRRIGAAQLAARREEQGITTAVARSRVTAARDRACERLRRTPWTTNAEVSGSWLRSGDQRPTSTESRTLDKALERGLVTMRGYDRVLRLAWTLADLDGAERPTAGHLGRALVLRGGAA
ncbi:YifB family Mg chelatase-like AAA ATPase [Rathayibacter caricis]|uniref:YifB family Mg chelatase-like AAA ATPase n=1 Tax=Rathayibacter caricis TaxID=110936 RepID=UPI001FB27F13|nr:YifB family Mg chelatase-like AAA ATPase [Rathayibacter caricis]MCJ1694640.1 YifB family Mg chelatase-like AAA ATPase [Rathayibacter caricis]